MKIEFNSASESPALTGKIDIKEKQEKKTKTNKNKKKEQKQKQKDKLLMIAKLCTKKNL